MTDSTKKTVWKWMSDAYGGAIQPNTNPDGDSVIDTLDLRFPGQVADSETGLFYNLNRYYDPLTARYTQSDPIGLAGGLNNDRYDACMKVCNKICKESGAAEAGCDVAGTAIKIVTESTAAGHLVNKACGKVVQEVNAKLSVRSPRKHV
jgi:RHS repeat-associated protein